MLTRLGSGPRGLATEEAERRLAETGPNTVADRPRLEIAAKIGRRLVEPLVAILLVAALVSGQTGDWPDGIPSSGTCAGSR
jgi:Mg2+-importing ATPase